MQLIKGADRAFLHSLLNIYFIILYRVFFGWWCDAAVFVVRDFSCLVILVVSLTLIQTLELQRNW